MSAPLTEHNLERIRERYQQYDQNRRERLAEP